MLPLSLVDDPPRPPSVREELRPVSVEEGPESLSEEELAESEGKLLMLSDGLPELEPLSVEDRLSEGLPVLVSVALALSVVVLSEGLPNVALVNAVVLLYRLTLVSF